MSAAEAVAEIWKKTFMFLAFAAVVLVMLSAMWVFYKQAGDVLHERDARIHAQHVLAEWSGTGNVSGVVQLSRVSSAALEPCTVARIYYANGTLAKEVRSPCK